MKKWSISWKSSKQRRKQRKYRFNAPLHVRQKLLSANLDKTLRKEYKKRSLPIRSGDEVVVVIGKYKGTFGKITEINLKKMLVYVDSVKVKKASGQEVNAKIDPSNLKIDKHF